MLISDDKNSDPSFNSTTDTFFVSYLVGLNSQSEGVASEEDDDDEDEDGDGFLVALLEDPTRRRFSRSEKKGEKI